MRWRTTSKRDRAVEAHSGAAADRRVRARGSGPRAAAGCDGVLAKPFEPQLVIARADSGKRGFRNTLLLKWRREAARRHPADLWAWRRRTSPWPTGACGQRRRRPPGRPRWRISIIIFRPAPPTPRGPLTPSGARLRNTSNDPKARPVRRRQCHRLVWPTLRRAGWSRPPASHPPAWRAEPAARTCREPGPQLACRRRR